MDKKYLKWSLLVPAVLLGLAILGALVYLLPHLAPGCGACATFLGGAIMLLILLGGFILSLSWFVAVIDIATSPTLKNNDKIIWLVVVFFLSFIGAAAYYFLVRRAQK